MTRRKQNAPKRLKSTDKSGTGLPNQQSVDTSQVTSDSGAEEGDEEGEEEEGDTTSDEDSVVGKQTDKHERVSGGGEEGGQSDTGQAAVSAPGGDTKRDKLDQTETGDTDREGPTSAGPASSVEKLTSNSSRVDERTLSWNSQSHMTTSSLSNSGKYKYSCKLSPPLISPSPGLGLPIDPQMALVMSSMPLALLSRGKSSASPLDPAMAFFPVAPAPPTDDQPLDLSRKTEKPPPSSSSSTATDSNIAVKRQTASAAPACVTTTSASNGFSSLQSLQQRFGGDYPLELSQKSAAAAVIPLQPSVSQKSAAASHGLPVSGDTLMRSAINKSKSSLHTEWLEKQEARTSASSPMLKGENSRHTSPMLIDEAMVEAGGKHTIHRCSCQKSFSTLYALSLHLQETGHTPGSGKAASLMDYPKLVRGQDMWLNQESEQTRRILRCMQCGESFKSLPLLTVHMMQTQHYTKIVSSDHGRRSHKCSTYCDRELDKECIFKCKVCHEAFSDMEGLANHMIVSGHHKKQPTRQVANPTALVDIPAGLASIARQGRRKRFLPEDMCPAEATPSTVASLLEYRRKQASSGSNGVGSLQAEAKSNCDSRSPETRPVKPVLCDSCGKHVDCQEFDRHVRACLRQRAEVIDALKHRLAAEEAILSKSESKLLRSGFNLSSLCGQREENFMEYLPRNKDHVLSEEQERCEQFTDKDKVSFDSTKVKSETPSPANGAQNQILSGAKISQDTETSAVICDLIEVPLKKWYCSTDNAGQPAGAEDTGSNTSEEDRSTLTPKKESQSVPQNGGYEVGNRIKKETVDPDMSTENKSSPGPAGKRRFSEAELAGDNYNRLPEKTPRLSPKLVQDTTEESLDFTSSALHKLDMFSRRLKFSPPRRAISPESKLPTHASGRTIKKRESVATSSIGNKKDQQTKSPQPISPSSVPQMKTEAQDPSNKNVTFDIIDPNADTEVSESKSSALEAMESFIHKSFSAKSDLRTSNLASMFSPFRNCFPIPGQTSMLPDATDPALSHFAKFSKFFRMVPGIPSFPEAKTAHVPENSKLPGATSMSSKTSAIPTTAELRVHDKSLSIGSKKLSVKAPSLSPALRVPAVRSTQDTPSVTTSTDISLSNSGLKKSSDSICSTKKYKYSTVSALDSLHLPAKNHQHAQVLPCRTGIPKELAETVTEESSLPSSLDQEKLKEDLKRKRQADFQDDPGRSDLKKINVSKAKNESDDDEKEECVRKNGYDDFQKEMSKSIEDNVNDGEDKPSSSGEPKPKSPPAGDSEIHKKSTAQVPKPNDDFKISSREEEKDENSVMEDFPARDNQQYSSAQSEMRVVLPDALKDGLDGDDDDDDMEDNNRNHVEHNSIDCEPVGDEVSEGPVNLTKDSGEKCEQSSLPNRSPTAETRSTSVMVIHEGTDETTEGANEECGRISASPDNSERNDLSQRDSEKEQISKIISVKCRKSKATNMHNTEIGKVVIMDSDDVDNDNVDDMVGIDNQSRINQFTDREIKSDTSPVDGAVDSSVEGECSQTDCEDNIAKLNSNEKGYSKTGEKRSKSRSPVSRGDEQLPGDGSASCILQESVATPACNSGHAISPGDADILSEPEVSISRLGSPAEDRVDKQKKKKKASALDSLSSFVYSQPLTSEHPLDSLQKLLSTNDLPHPSADQSKLAAATSYKCSTPDLSTPLNLTTKPGGGGVSSGGCSSDDNDEGEVGVMDGGASEGEGSEYKCAACNRRFASKGSYRYHLSRCHLSSVKKYGIKEAFNMSPYVYLPLDHTAKFSKYYQMAQELANKGK